MTDSQDGSSGLPGQIPDPATPEASEAVAPPVAAPEPSAFPEPSELSAGPLASPALPSEGQRSNERRPTFLFFGVVAAISLAADVSTKAWAEITLIHRSALEPSIHIIKDHLAFTLAYNPGGAWGLFQRQSEYVRRPFFLLVSLLAIAFIINLYGRLTPQQKALKWGLPLVLGGALGNLSDRIIRSNVIDFIDYQARWIEAMNRLVGKLVKGWAVTDHWPTFNVADIAICVGVGLMAVDMFTSRRGASASLPPRPPTLNVSESTPPLKPEA